MPSSRGSSQLSDWTQVSRVVGRFFIIWATREACVCVCVCVLTHTCVFIYLPTYLSSFHPSSRTNKSNHYQWVSKGGLIRDFHFSFIHVRIAIILITSVYSKKKINVHILINSILPALLWALQMFVSHKQDRIPALMELIVCQGRQLLIKEALDTFHVWCKDN